MTKITWNEENTARLVELAGPEGSTVSQEQLNSIAEELDTTNRSIGAKLRKMGYEVEKASAKPSAWSQDEVVQLTQTLEDNDGAYTYAELAEVFLNGKFSAKQLQGKVLSLELTDKVRKAEKKEAPRKYSDDEEARFCDLCNSGASIETLANEFNRTVASVRGKALSLLRSEKIGEMPKQESSNAKERSDVLEGLDVSSMTVEQIAEQTGKSVRGIKSMLSRRGISCEDYDGASRREKLDSQKAE